MKLLDLVEAKNGYNQGGLQCVLSVWAMNSLLEVFHLLGLFLLC